MGGVFLRAFYSSGGYLGILMWSAWAEILNRVGMRDRRSDGHGVFQLPCYLQESHLEGQRDLVSRLITP